MSLRRQYLCGGVQRPRKTDPRRDWETKSLTLDGAKPDVTLKVEDLCRQFQRDLTPRLADLLEIAAYLYAVDRHAHRGVGFEQDRATERWARELHLVVPVADYKFWNAAGRAEALSGMLHDLTDDTITFTFRQRKERESFGYLDFGEREEWPFRNPDRVRMFSGGLDSLAGAIDTADRGEPLVLVSHRSVSTIDSQQKGLRDALAKHYADAEIMHVPVLLHMRKDTGRDAMQRSRSFLYATLGAVVASSLGAGGVRFFENGVTSLNLPVADQVLGARASRTTHPATLAAFQTFFSEVLDRELIVDNPYLTRTKADVIRGIVDAGRGDLIRLSCSCVHTVMRPASQWHCGTCSQCVDRRFAALAAGAGRLDHRDGYQSDVLTGPRKEGYDLDIGIDYVRQAEALHKLGWEGIAGKYLDEITDAARAMPGKLRDNAETLCKLLARHAGDVCEVLDRQASANSRRILAHDLPDSSLLGMMVFDGKHLLERWERYADRLTGVLARGVPKACRARPENEKHLQEVCDGLLDAAGERLHREFPSCRWGSKQATPDYSDEEAGLWVELKYVRKKEHVRRITEEMAADVTKYGDSGRRTLFVIYDPDRHIPDDADFLNDVDGKRGHAARVIR